ncbi:MAG: hypothetical protein LUP94_01290, partial [Candidatus Methanomethylicus sp.]|nr:hypothetical protein [Candidatus Methanomethylicus sp.]
PIEGGGYAVQIGTSLFGISTAIGFFPIWQLWLAFAMIFLVGISLARLKRGTVKPPYYGGENLEGKPQMFRSAADSEIKFSISGMFFDSIINESYFGKLAVIGGIAVIALMVLVVVL